jgi:hypothetical protein
LNVKKLEASAKHFYNVENIELTATFADLFFKDIQDVFKERDRDYAATFFANLSPTFLKREADLA